MALSFRMTPIDVYLGRGGMKKNEFYRKVIHKHCREYSELHTGDKKGFIIANVVVPILKAGRFFYNHSPTNGSNVWRIASDDEIVKNIGSAPTTRRVSIREFLENKILKIVLATKLQQPSSTSVGQAFSFPFD